MAHHDAICEGCQVTLHYRLLLPDGTVVDSTLASGPATVRIGASHWLPALERSLYGLRPGDKRRIEISGMETVSEASEEFVHPVPAEMFSADVAPCAGAVIGFQMPDGSEVAGTIVELKSEEVLVDFSSPLAGRDLVFEVDIVDVTTSTKASNH